MLGGREAVAACELLLLRARADLDAGRAREAALQLRVGARGAAGRARGARAPDQERGPRRRSTARDAITVAGAPNDALAGRSTGERSAELPRPLRIAERVLRRRGAALG